MNAATRTFSVGPLSFRLETGTGLVRALRFHGREVLRGIYPAVRDRDWNTLPPELAAPEIDHAADRVRVRVDARVPQVDLEWTTTIEANARGGLRYAWRATVRRGFFTDRTGLCVLHPAELAGAPCEIEHVDGRVTAAWFPHPVAPEQPFHAVRAITHVLAGGAEVRVRMDGETFETEDQRNWSDASFKTYCRPLEWPRPYHLEAGAIIEHVVTVTVHGTPAPAPAAPPRVRLGAAGELRLPRLGFTLPGPLPPAWRERLRNLRPHHLRVETTPGELAATLRWARRAAEETGCALDVAIRGATPAAPRRAAFPPDATASLFSEEGNSVPGEILRAWHDAGFTALGTGTLHHFTDLNRQRPPASAPHTFTTFGLNAQVHAFDDTSMLETTTQHPVLARHAAAIGGGRGVVVAPIVLGPAPDAADPRLHTDFGGLWLISSLAGLASAGVVVRATYFRTHGPGGLLRDDTVTPVEHCLRALAAATRIERLAPEPGESAPLHALVTHGSSGSQLLLAHPGDQALTVELPPLARTVELLPQSLLLVRL